MKCSNVNKKAPYAILESARGFVTIIIVLQYNKQIVVCCEIHVMSTKQNNHGDNPVRDMKIY